MSENFNNAILPEPLGGVNPFVNLILPDGAGQSEPGSFAIPSPLPQDQLPIQSFAHDNMFAGQIQEAIALSPPSGQQPPGPAPADPIVGATFVVNQEAVNFTTDGNNASADGTPWHLRSDVNSDADAKITNVWDKGVRGQNVVIGILDNGFEINDTDKNMPGHPDLLTNYRPDLSYDFDEEDAYPSRLLNRTIAYSGRRSTISDRSSLGSSFFMDVPLSGGVVHGLKVNLEIEHDAESGLDVLLFAPQKDPENDRQEVKVLSDVGDGEYSLDLTSDFQGIKANGSWKLKIKDKNTRDGKSGSVENWSLELETVNSHGTSVAGVAAASGDNGISGVAPLAQWAGLRMGADGTDDEEIARALSHKNDEIDIYNNSWGTGFFQEFPAAELALAEAVNNGRGGLGNIYVFSGGNAQRDELDNPHGNVNYHSLANSRHTIAVAAIDHEGKQALYSEPGAPLLVSAYSSGGGEEGDRAISTTGPYSDDGNDENDYNHAFGGTSASAPFVSGVIALMLEANSQLTSRDVQHILVKTAQKNDPDDDDWSENGARYHVNHKYGFGAIDAEAAVDRARNWISVGEEISVGKQQLVDRHIPNYDPEDPQSLSSRITIDPEDDMTVEWVEVEFDGTHNYLGQLEIVLISPDGTESVLAENHGNGQYILDDDSYEWTFTSARHWGELAVGDWTLVVKDKDERNPSDADFWNSWELRIFGKALQPNIVTNTKDSGVGSLRDAIAWANENPGRDTILFDIRGDGPHTISPASALPNITEAVAIDGWSQNGGTPPATPLIELSGSNAGDSNGLSITGSNVEVRGLVINNWQRNGIEITGEGATDNWIYGNFIGTNTEGTAAIGNARNGIDVRGNSNIIGTNGDGVGDATEGNLISGNEQNGVFIVDASSNIVAGNLIGTNKDGTGEIANLLDGVDVRGDSNIIGTNGDNIADATEGNLISGNEHNGVNIVDASYNIVAGNSIGTNRDGTGAIANLRDGVEGVRGDNNIIGTNGDGIADEIEGNLISGNASNGVMLSGDFNKVAGNHIGTNRDGTGAIANIVNGVDVHGNSNTIGTNGDGIADEIEGNLISGNEGNGVRIVDASDNLVAGNLIGTNKDGTGAIANLRDGVEDVRGNNNIIGTNGDGIADEIEGNLISGNENNGVSIVDASFTIVAGNLIGTNKDGTGAIANAIHGVTMRGDNNIIGTNGDGNADSAEGNLISGNSKNGVDISKSSGNIIAGNYIGTNKDGTGAIANLWDGVEDVDGDNNIIGTNGDGIADEVEGNLISGNGRDGVTIGYVSNNIVAGNRIGTNKDGTGAIANLWDGVDVLGDNNIIGTNGDGIADAIEGNLISGNGGDGVKIVIDANITDTGFNRVAGNHIGTNKDGTGEIANIGDGVDVRSNNNIIGTNGDGIADAIEGNLISGNENNGVSILDASDNIVAGNSIGTNKDGTGAIANLRDGVDVRGDNNIIGTNGDGIADAIEGNLISGNEHNGVNIVDANDNIVAGNSIGTNRDGTGAIANLLDGVDVRGDNNIIGTNGDDTADATESNLISGNGQDGVSIVYANDNIVAGNYIGTNKQGTGAIANLLDGVDVRGNNNIIGTNGDGIADAAEGNLISGNGQDGVNIMIDPNIIDARENIVAGNHIGTNKDGTGAIANLGDGVDVRGNNNIIGTNGDGIADEVEGNLISGNEHSGVRIANVTDNIVAGNSIGTNKQGTGAIGNSLFGVSVTGDNNIIGTNGDGTADADEGNLISGNEGTSGLYIFAESNIIAGNHIGTNLEGTEALANSSWGVWIGGGANNIIGTNGDGTADAAEGNLISGNSSTGVVIYTDFNIVAGNRIGTNIHGTGAIPNGEDGVSGGGKNNRIGGTNTGEGNIIAFNNRYGVWVGGSIQGNAIFANAGLGINLGNDGVTANDLGDRDTGVNNLQNFPELTSATSDTATTTIQGTLNSTANTTFTLELFANSALDESGYGEGETFLGSQEVTTDSDGNANFTANFSTPVAIGQFITATATDPNGNTSEFSQGVEVGDNEPVESFTFSQKILAPDGAREDYFGSPIALNGNYALIHSVTKDDKGTYTGAAGSAYLFDISSGDLLHKFIAPDGAREDSFGKSVALNGNYALVSSWRDPDNGIDSGSAYLFDISSGDLLQKFIAPDGDSYDRFGWSVALDVDYALISSEGDEDNGYNSGSAYLFDISSGDLLHKFIAPDGAGYDVFGKSVALDRDYALIGSPLNDDNGTNSGSAYLFDISSGNLLQKFIAPDGASFDHFGWSVALDGDYALIGSWGDYHGSGSAYLFDISSGELLQKFIAPDRASFDHFGWSVALDGDYALIGSYGDDDNGSDSGSAYLFDISSGELLQKFIALDGASDDRFGYSIALDGNSVLIGLDRDSAYLFTIE